MLNQEYQWAEPDAFYAGDKKRISVFATVRRIREQRWNMVKTADQYKYIYSFFAKWVSSNFN